MATGTKAIPGWEWFLVSEYYRWTELLFRGAKVFSRGSSGVTSSTLVLKSWHSNDCYLHCFPLLCYFPFSFAIVFSDFCIYILSIVTLSPDFTLLLPLANNPFTLNACVIVVLPKHYLTPSNFSIGLWFIEFNLAWCDGHVIHVPSSYHHLMALGLMVSKLYCSRTLNTMLTHLYLRFQGVLSIGWGVKWRTPPRHHELNAKVD